MYNLSTGDLLNLQNIDCNDNDYATIDVTFTQSNSSNPRVFIDSCDWNGHISDVSIDPSIRSFSLDMKRMQWYYVIV